MKHGKIDEKISEDDPRQSFCVHPWKPERLDPDQLPPDYASIASIFLAVLGLTLRVKTFVWIALFCCLSSLAKVEYSTMDLKQQLFALSFCTLGLVFNYVFELW
mmetsp:Transcript_19378/g.23575  ORF Transcript_19378/g.23575 Transcript_19378/m.23575 type:complete len:104 (-) Transcript_19378:618-929(-)